ncbi:SWI/SNF chromatin-remodeling complex subunit sol1 [Erysiphe necator]|nr:SWI/SNF chromatin-remodeling complex subunit sol1 [Erysiphe necator]
MSSPWVNKSVIQNQNGPAYASNDLETSGYNNSAPFDSFESSQIQNQQLQRMQNGNLRNGSPVSFSNSQYQTNSLVPSKRPREEGMRTSPQQTPGLLPLSRSRTPQQTTYSSFQSGTQSQQHSTQQIPFSHLQDGSGNATPSPVMGNQIRPSGIGVPQRVSTASPHPFSPAVQQFPQASPSFSDQSSNRLDGSQQSNQYAQNSGYIHNFGTSYSPPLGHSSTTLQLPKTTPFMRQSLIPQGPMPQLYQQPQPQQQQSAAAAPQQQPQQQKQPQSQTQQNQPPSQPQPQPQQQQQQQQQPHQQQQQPHQQPQQQPHQHQQPQQQPQQHQLPQPKQLQHQQQQQQSQSQQQPQGHQQQQQQQQQRLLYQMQLQQQQQRNIISQCNSITPSTTPINSQQIQAKNGNFQGSRSSLPYPINRASPNPENFMKSLVSFMQAKKLPLEIKPIIGNRAVSLASLYSTVAKFGGYKAVEAIKGWGDVASALQFHSIEQRLAPLLLKGIYERNLFLFEEAITINQHNQRTQLMQPNSNLSVPQISPTKQQNSQSVPLNHQKTSYLSQQIPISTQPQDTQIPVVATPVKQVQPLTHQQVTPSNGYSTPQQTQMQLNSLTSHTYSQDSISKNLETTPPQNNLFPTPSPASVSVSVTGSRGLALNSPQIDSQDIRVSLSHKFNLPSVYEPKTFVLDTFGGVNIPSLARLGGELTRLKIDVPAVGDLGTIDVHALTMSLQSGIHAEVRLALDTLVCLSVEPRLQLDLHSCEDLIDTLIDCAELQVELLVENAIEVSDVMLVGSYEDVIRGCRLEQDFLQDLPVLGSLEYKLDRAVDRLICITTILRNLSFYEANHPLLADELIIKFLCVVIRHLGTRNMLLRTHSNTLDFMKDIVVFLSNLAQQIELPGREQALCLLHFLLAFAPCPTPNSSSLETVIFSSYNPNVHRYLPPAVDSLAKLLARDEPNRSLYKVIFTSDVASIPPYDLLTRAFALAISCLPDNGQDLQRSNILPIIEARKPFLMQGILAAGIISSLVPSYETGVAKSWLTSEDGFSQNLCRLIITLSIETSSLALRQPMTPLGIDNESTFHIILGGTTVLRRLVEKSRNSEDSNSKYSPPGVLAKDSLLIAINIVQPRLQDVLKQLYEYVGLGN